MRIVFSLIFVVTLSACGQAPTSFSADANFSAQSIIGGTESGANDYTAVGALLYSGEQFYGSRAGGLLCTGTLIELDTVLLAAHCLDEQMLGGMVSNVQYFFTFAVDVTSYQGSLEEFPPDTYELKAGLPHPGFSLDNLNNARPGLNDFQDIALIFLAEKISDRTPAMVLGATDSAGLVINTTVDIVGYGQRTAESDPWGMNPPETGIKYQAESKINKVGDSEMQIGDRAPIPQKCHGDSGGPTFLQYSDEFMPAERLVGVTSHAYDETDCERGGVDTRVDVYRDWIDSEMRKACTNGTRVFCTNNNGALPAPMPKEQEPPPEDPDDPPSNFSPLQQPDDSSGGCHTGGRFSLLGLLSALILGVFINRGRLSKI